jgi:hypothetical protein
MVRAQAAYERTLPRFESLHNDAVVNVTFAVGESAATAFQVAQRCNGAAMRPRFETLAASGLWSIAALDGLTDAALAAYFVDAQVREAESVATFAKVPAKLATEAKDLRERMDQMLTFLFAKDAKLAPVLDGLRAGRGHQGTVAALLRYAQLYGEHHALVSITPVHYQATDKDDASRVGGQILDALYALDGGAVERWSQLRRRAATHLLDLYEEVAAAGRFLERKDPDGTEAHYPSLVAAGRTYGKAPAKPAKPEPIKNDPTKPT